MNKKELAEQLLRKLATAEGFESFSRMLLNYNQNYIAQISIEKVVIAAIIESMGEKPESEKDKSVIEAARHHAQSLKQEAIRADQDFVPTCNFGYSYQNIKTEDDDVTFFLRNLAWGKNDDFKYALKQLVLRLRKVEILLNIEQGVQVSDTRNDDSSNTAD